jgi:large subunit ribosomal protein L25
MLPIFREKKLPLHSKKINIMKTVTIEGQLRTEFGKKATRQVRSEGKVPGVIYGGAEEIHFSAPTLAFKDLVYTAEFQFAEIKVGGKAYKCVLKDLQFDKVSDALAHIDLLELVDDKKIVVNIPIKLVGVSPGVKSGGKLVSKMNSLKIKTLPKYLKENIEVSISTLEINANIRVEDVVAENYEIMNSLRIPIASVVMTRQLKQEEAADAKAAPKKK